MSDAWQQVKPHGLAQMYFIYVSSPLSSYPLVALLHCLEILRKGKNGLQLNYTTHYTTTKVSIHYTCSPTNYTAGAASKKIIS